jgi:hypothetical protein
MHGSSPDSDQVSREFQVELDDEETREYAADIPDYWDRAGGER